MVPRTDTTPDSRACCHADLAVPADVRLRTAALATLCKALGDRTRLQIVALLARAGGPLCACLIEAHFDLAQPTISHHLRVLRQAGVIRGERRGTWIHYELTADALQATDALRDLLARTESGPTPDDGRKP